jgi:broad specificity phosphatase PhoE
MIKIMEVFLMRHGRRPYTLGDVPLNEEGKEQALDLTRNPSLQSIKTLLASPKKRSQMTLEPLAKKLGVKIQIEENLDQHRSGEDEEKFIQRVRKVIDQISDGHWSSPILLCSHSDWLSLSTRLIPTDEIELEHHMFQCAEYLHFQIEEGLWKLKS